MCAVAGGQLPQGVGTSCPFCRGCWCCIASGTRMAVPLPLLQARLAAPSIIFLDELDAIAGAPAGDRGGGRADAQGRKKVGVGKLGGDR